MKKLLHPIHLFALNGLFEAQRIANRGLSLISSFYLKYFAKLVALTCRADFLRFIRLARYRVSLLMASLMLFTPLKLSAETFTYWGSPGNFSSVFFNAKDVCDYFYSDMHWSHLKHLYMPEANEYKRLPIN